LEYPLEYQPAVGREEALDFLDQTDTAPVFPVAVDV
jgi:hypothetical protein